MEDPHSGYKQKILENKIKNDTARDNLGSVPPCHMIVPPLEEKKILLFPLSLKPKKGKNWLH
jgi:hypothetical protein